MEWRSRLLNLVCVYPAFQAFHHSYLQKGSLTIPRPEAGIREPQLQQSTTTPTPIVPPSMAVEGLAQCFEKQLVDVEPTPSPVLANCKRPQIRSQTACIPQLLDPL